MSCASCHDPAREFTDARPRAMGRKLLDRNTQSLWNLAGQRWFGWAGAADSLWSHNIIPLLNADEFGHSHATLKTNLASGAHRADFTAIFGPIDTMSPEETSVNIAKTIAAYLETLTTGKTSFDHFRDALAAGDMAKAGTYPAPAQRGLQIFLGAGNCSFCHAGPAFTNGEFHDAGVPYFIEQGRVDLGRFGGLNALQNSRFTLAGDYNDDPTKAGAWAVENVRFQHSDFGIFRVPSLRRAARTAPFMHDGSLPDLRAVLDHYNDINMERLHSDGEAILRPLGLGRAALNDLQSFLETLADDP